MKNRGLRVKHLRLKNGDTLKSLAEKIDYDDSNLSKIERGVYKGSINIFEKIAQVYGVDVSYFSYTDKELETFTDNERDLLFERDLSTNAIKEKYSIISNKELDNNPLTDEEIEKIVEYVKALRIMKQNQAPK